MLVVLIAVAVSTGCRSSELASKNVYNVDKAPQPAFGYPGELDITDDTVAPLRNKLKLMFPGEKRLGTITITSDGSARLDIDPALPWSYSGQLLPQMLPQLISSPKTLSNLLNPVDIDLGKIEHVDELFSLGSLSSSDTLTLTITMDPDDIVLGYMPVWNADKSETDDTPGLWFPIRIDFPDGFGSLTFCDCDHPGTATNPAFCPELCKQLSDASAHCGLTQQEVVIQHVPLALGLVPEIYRPAVTAPWTTHIDIEPRSDGSFGPGRNFHLGAMVNVVAMPGGLAAKYAQTFPDFNPSLCDESDICTSGYLVRPTCSELSNLGCLSSGCDRKFAQGFADAIAEKLAAAFDKAVKPYLDQFFEYDGSLFWPNAPTAETFPPCNLATNCDQTDLVQDLLPASVTYQKWDWFLGPFNQVGPTNSWYDRIAAIYPAPVGSKHLGSLHRTIDLAEIAMAYTTDGDGDQRPNDLDNCPDVYNPDQADDDGDGVGNACDPCPCSHDETTYTSDHMCGVCDASQDQSHTGFCATWCPAHPVDNCPDVKNPNQDNCNLQAELASDDTPLGNACDPVPCANATADGDALVAPFAPAECQGASSPPLLGGGCYAMVDTTLKWHGVVDDDTKSHSGQAEFAHCPCLKAHGTVGDRLKNCSSSCAFNSAASFPAQYGQLSGGWGGITTTLATGTGPGSAIGTAALGNLQECYGGFCKAAKAEPLRLNPTDYKLTGSGPRQAQWRFAEDLPEFGVATPAQTDDYSQLEQDLDSIDDQLQGVGWAFTPSYEGSALGGEARNLASHFFRQDLDPLVIGAVPPPGLAVPECWLAPCASQDVSPWLFPGGSGPVMLETDRYYKPAPPGMLTDDVRAALAGVGTTYTLVPAAETVERLTAQDEPLRAALVDSASGGFLLPIDFTNGTITLGYQIIGGGGLGAPVHSGAAHVAPASSPHAVALSGLRHELYTVIPGPDGGETLLRQDLDQSTIDFRTLHLHGAPAGQPLAMAYLHDRDVLYLLDQTRSGGHTMLRVIALGRNGWGRPIATIQERGLYDRLFLGNDYKGRLVLSASPHRAGARPLFAVLEPDGQGLELRAWGYGEAAGQLIAQPDTRNPVRWTYARRTDKGNIRVSAIQPAHMHAWVGPMEKGLAGVL